MFDRYDTTPSDLNAMINAYYTASYARDAHAGACLVCVLARHRPESRGERCTEFAQLDRELDGAFEAWLWYEPTWSIQDDQECKQYATLGESR